MEFLVAVHDESIGAGAVDADAVEHVRQRSGQIDRPCAVAVVRISRGNVEADKIGAAMKVRGFDRCPQCAMARAVIATGAGTDEIAVTRAVDEVESPK